MVLSIDNIFQDSGVDRSSKAAPLPEGLDEMKGIHERR